MRAADVYRALLWCYPAQFRHEYGGEMIGAFSEQLRDARRTSGRLAAGRHLADHARRPPAHRPSGAYVT